MSDKVVLEPVYNPRAIEGEVYAAWESAGAFRSVPDGTPHARTFCVMIPLPNVTGALHLGHALNNTLQDILTRWHRMRGFNALWQPGTDHAGIATQAVVERRIREQEGLSRHDLGREELVRRIWLWKDEYEKRIISQLKLMGCSCDWSRTRFTLDAGCARAVRTQFFQLFKAGLIFRGKRLVNWDTQLQTAVADDEVYYESVKGHFWHFKYPVIDPKPGEPTHVVIATTRPETMLGDTAVAVHPDPEGFFTREEARLRGELDQATPKERKELEQKLEALAARRESHLQQLVTLRDMARDGRKLLLPLVERPIPLIRDEWADPTKGSGCVKITPAHDPNDYEVGLRHGLAMISVLTADGKVARIIEPNGSVNAHSRGYEGLAFATEGRAKVVADLEARGLVEAVEDHEVEVGHSDRSKVPIEPYLSDQWFLRTAEVSEAQAKGGAAGGLELAGGQRVTGLAQAALNVVHDGRIRVFPERYTKTYLDWLGEKRDWCISRQLWWGHRIPIWHKHVRVDGAGGAARWWGAIGLDRMSAGQDDDAALLVCRGDGGEPVPPRAVLDPGGQPGEYDLYVCLLDDEAGAINKAVLEKHGFVQDDDVLDTWFSSALWPFSTLGWPDRTEHLKQYYPGTVLVTSRDIITNWVARMVMFGLFALGDIPFDHVYVHPKILDGRGETMSKSKGNGVDPVDIIDIYGADALRYSMADMTTETQDIRMPVEYLCPHCRKLVDQAVAMKVELQARKSRGEKLLRELQPADCKRVKCTHCGKEFATQWADAALKEKLGLARDVSEKFEIGRNFCNKLWNAARFAFMNLEGTPCNRLDVGALPVEDRWILARLSETVRRFHQCLSAYQFSAAIKEVREFFWESLCDWYIELTKPRLGPSAASSSPDARATAQQVLALCLDQVLRLLHPMMPFITERLWQPLNVLAPRRGLPGVADLKTDGLLIRAPFPPEDGYPALEDEAILTTFAALQNATRGVRDVRMQCNVPPKQKVTVTVVLPAEHVEAFKAQAHIVQHMAHIGELTVVGEARRPRNAGSVTIKGVRLFVHDISDDVADRERTEKALADARKQIAGKEAKLGNEQFVAHAKPEVVAAERERLAELIAQRDALQAHLTELQA
ncbi:MAG TPA: valine--tRNA ligase [Phycisphaerae bacterium]|nr:valine--tRNA ligase [Phycisphaerae bacterium]HNU45947.1 valine--tRNA ligase [Phycisphaerae bacterium]